MIYYVGLLQKRQHLNIFDLLLSRRFLWPFSTVTVLHQNFVYSQMKLNARLPMVTKLYSFSLFIVLSANYVVRTPHGFAKAAFYTYVKTATFSLWFPGSQLTSMFVSLSNLKNSSAKQWRKWEAKAKLPLNTESKDITSMWLGCWFKQREKYSIQKQWTSYH